MKKSGKYKTRIESWLKDAEKDAEKAEEYLGRKKEKLKEVESKRCKLLWMKIICINMLKIWQTFNRYFLWGSEYWTLKIGKNKKTELFCVWFSNFLTIWMSPPCHFSKKVLHKFNLIIKLTCCVIQILQKLNYSTKVESSRKHAKMLSRKVYEIDPSF